jgi:hypothetical protein
MHTVQILDKHPTSQYQKGGESKRDGVRARLKDTVNKKHRFNILQSKQKVHCITSPNTTMHRSHMIIDTNTVRERLHTHPTDMSLAHSTRHVVAPLRPFDWDFAPWTRFHVIVLHPLLEKILATVFVWTVESVVRFDMAAGADAEQTRGTLKDGIRRRRAIHLGTVRCRAVVELALVLLNVCCECRLH